MDLSSSHDPLLVSVGSYSLEDTSAGSGRVIVVPVMGPPKLVPKPGIFIECLIRAIPSLRVPTALQLVWLHKYPPYRFKTEESCFLTCMHSSERLHTHRTS